MFISICHELCLYVVAINLCTSTSIALLILLYSGTKWTYLSIALASEIEWQTSHPLQVSMRALFEYV